MNKQVFKYHVVQVRYGGAKNLVLHSGYSRNHAQDILNGYAMANPNTQYRLERVEVDE